MGLPTSPEDAKAKPFARVVMISEDETLQERLFQALPRGIDLIPQRWIPEIRTEGRFPPCVVLDSSMEGAHDFLFRLTEDASSGGKLPLIVLARNTPECVQLSRVSTYIRFLYNKERLEIPALVGSIDELCLAFAQHTHRQALRSRLGRRHLQPTS